METVRGPTYVALAYYFILFRYSYRLHPYTLVRFNSLGASLRSILWQQSTNAFTVQFGTLNLALYALASNHVFGQ